MAQHGIAVREGGKHTHVHAGWVRRTGLRLLDQLAVHGVWIRAVGRVEHLKQQRARVGRNRHVSSVRRNTEMHLSFVAQR
ncbi:Uncharacterised protein [Mycobacteroides abscessus subsp. abscessus]|nr:Uncharacterised protein [Mycobacteroides abscessus subsp. abscessus]